MIAVQAGTALLPGSGVPRAHTGASPLRSDSRQSAVLGHEETAHDVALAAKGDVSRLRAGVSRALAARAQPRPADGGRPRYRRDHAGRVRQGLAEARGVPRRLGVRHLAAPARRERHHRALPRRHGAAQSHRRRRRPLRHAARARRSRAICRWISRRRSRNCRTARARYSSCTTSRATSTMRSRTLLGISAGTSKAQLHRARMMLRRHLRPGIGAAIEDFTWPHDAFTDRLSDYIDDEVSDEERRQIDAHLLTCAECRTVVEELRNVVAHAASLEDTPAAGDLWPGIAARVRSQRPRGSGLVLFRRLVSARRFSFTVPQLAAATLAVMLLSGGVVWMARSGDPRADFESLSAQTQARTPMVARCGRDRHALRGSGEPISKGHSRPDGRGSIPRPCGSSRRTSPRSIARSTSRVARSRRIQRTCTQSAPRGRAPAEALAAPASERSGDRRGGLRQGARVPRVPTCQGANGCRRCHR